MMMHKITKTTANVTVVPTNADGNTSRKYQQYTSIKSCYLMSLVTSCIVIPNNCCCGVVEDRTIHKDIIKTHIW